MPTPVTTIDGPSSCAALQLSGTGAGRLCAVVEGLLVKDPERRFGVDQARAGLQAVQRACATGGPPR
jgi:hypothetical protein